MTETPQTDLLATDIVWELDPLLDGSTANALLDRADSLADGLRSQRGRIGSLDPEGLSDVLRTLENVHDAILRASSHANLSYVIDTTDADRARQMQASDERVNRISKELLFIELEWAALDDAKAEGLLEHDALAWCRHWLRSMRRYRPHLLSEPEERIISDKDLTGSRAFGRLFDELSAAITCQLPVDDAMEEVPLDRALSRLMHPVRPVRENAAMAVSNALLEDVRTRAFVYNTLLADKAAEDTLRGYPHWLSSRNLANEASDASVQALIDSVVARYPLAQRWYRLKATLLEIDVLEDHDRYAPLSPVEVKVGWNEARELVLGAYASFSSELAGHAKRFFEEPWIHAPVQPGKMGGAFCAYTSARHHPYLLLNWNGTATDVLTLAHELGHGLHAMMARNQGVFQQNTPLTLAETASVFGETVTFGSLMDSVADDEARLALLARSIEGNLATVFRQIAMCRFEDRVHTERRTKGELSVDAFCTAWMETQEELYGDSVRLDPRYRVWWSYVPHFISTPGYVYAYAYGQLLALSVYHRYTEQGRSFVPAYHRMLAAGGSMPPAEITRLVGCDLEDPGFWDAGLDLVAAQIDEAEALAQKLGRV